MKKSVKNERGPHPDRLDSMTGREPTTNTREGAGKSYYTGPPCEKQGGFILTVKEILAILDLSWDGNLVNFNFKSEIEVDTWGDYVVRSIHACKEGAFELALASRPIKKGAEA